MNTHKRHFVSLEGGTPACDSLPRPPARWPIGKGYTSGMEKDPKRQWVEKVYTHHWKRYTIGYGKAKGTKCSCATKEDVYSCLKGIKKAWDGTTYIPGIQDCRHFVYSAKVKCCLSLDYSSEYL